MVYSQLDHAVLPEIGTTRAKQGRIQIQIEERMAGI